MLKTLKYVSVPFALNLAGLYVSIRITGNERVVDYLSGTFAGIVLSAIWLIQVKFVSGGSFLKVMKIIFGGLFLKMVLIAVVFFTAHSFWVKNTATFAASLLYYLFLLLVSEILYYSLNAEKIEG